MRRVVADLPDPLGVRACHDVEVVEVVAGRGHRRAVPAVGDEDRVARADLGADVDLLARAGAVDPLVAAGTGLACRVRGVGLEVVDLLQPRLVLARLVVLVRRERRPVAARGDHLDGDHLVGLERRRGAEVVDLPAGLSRPAELDLHALGGAVAGGQPPVGAGPAEREPAALLRGHRGGGVARDVGEVGDAGEDPAAPGEGEGLAVTRHRARPGQRQDDPLALAGVERVRPARGQFQDVEAAVCPAGALRGDRERVVARAAGAGRDDDLQLVGHHVLAHSRPTAVSTAVATSSPGG